MLAELSQDPRLAPSTHARPSSTVGKPSFVLSSIQERPTCMAYTQTHKNKYPFNILVAEITPSNFHLL